MPAEEERKKACALLCGTDAPTTKICKYPPLLCDWKYVDIQISPTASKKRNQT
jgi:hypothetical protein